MTETLTLKHPLLICNGTPVALPVQELSTSKPDMNATTKYQQYGYLQGGIHVGIGKSLNKTTIN